ncbi:MAG: hypothetical protein IJH39_07980 [Clostridia bacterium]|nr:hypothetical protein [Clostridia bacterium]
MKTNIKMGLTKKEVEERIEKKQVNYDTSVPTKSIKRILYENFFTLFNFLNLFLGIAVFLCRFIQKYAFSGCCYYKYCN